MRRIQVIENNAAHLAHELPLESVQNANDEIGRLGKRLEDTSRLLEQRRNALQSEAEHLANEVKERERSEEALRQNKARLEVAIHTNQLIMDNSRDVICTVDKAGRFVTVSAACETLWGYKPKEVIGRRYIDMVYPEDQARTNQAALDIMAGSATTDFENRYICKDGSLIDVMWSSYWSEEDGMMFAVAHDVTERTRLKKVLQQAKDDADRANHAKSEFLSRMSHELRTPLNAILGFGQLLQRQNPTDTQRDRISHILSAGRHLLGLINEVLDISRIEAGQLQLSLEPVSIVDALGEAIDLMRPLAAERSTELMSPRREDTEILRPPDRQRLKQVLLNLLTNAVKYTPPGGRVMVSCTSSENEQIRIAVSDNGPGIPIEKLTRLFTPFDRLGAEQSGVEGTGLGLALCQRLLQAMRGVIGVNSSVGEGSSFWIELPRTESPLERVSSLKELAISQSQKHRAGRQTQNSLHRR